MKASEFYTKFQELLKYHKGQKSSKNKLEEILGTKLLQLTDTLCCMPLIENVCIVVAYNCPHCKEFVIGDPSANQKKSTIKIKGMELELPQPNSSQGNCYLCGENIF